MKLNFLLPALLALLSLNAGAAAVTDVKDFSNNTSTEYFVEDDASRYDRTWWRASAEDWVWQHNAISGSFSSITLEVSAFDVDYDDGEWDMISVFSGTDWIDLGLLDGGDDEWAFTLYDLSGFEWAEAQVNLGLQVRVDIDTQQNGWLVTLGKSVLTTDGGDFECVPTPGQPCETVDVPEPSVLAILGLGLVLLRIRRK